jgi:hypothetical protein
MSFTFPGYLYIMYNDCYEHYGTNFYKLGRSKNPEQRMSGYRTPFIDKSKYLYVSERSFKDSVAAEYVLFCLLKKFRVHPKREFFNYKLDSIIETIQILEQMNDEDITQIYSKLKNTVFTNFYIKKYFEGLPQITENVYNGLDEFFDAFKFRPKHPEDYYRFGYREDNHELKLKEIEEKLKEL